MTERFLFRFFKREREREGGKARENENSFKREILGVTTSKLENREFSVLIEN